MSWKRFHSLLVCLIEGTSTPKETNSFLCTFRAPAAGFGGGSAEFPNSRPRLISPGDEDTPNGFSSPQSELHRRKTPVRNLKKEGSSGPSQKGAAGQTELSSYPKPRTLKIPWESSLHMDWLCVSWSIGNGRGSPVSWKVTLDGSRATSESPFADPCILIMQLLWMFPKQEIGQAFFWVSPPESGLPSVIGLAGRLPGTTDFLGFHSRTAGPGPDNMLGYTNPEPLMDDSGPTWERWTAW